MRDSAKPDMIHQAEGAEAGFFGDRPVDPSVKTKLVRGVFDNVAARYDTMNDLMSGGIHRLWKRQLVHQIRPRAGQKVLDMAGGTGDIALLLQKQAGAELEVTLCDINTAMLGHGRVRATDKGHVRNLTWICGNAETPPLAEKSFDIYTIAFGLRNVTHIDRALESAYRLLRPGGRFFCLEFCPRPLFPLAPAYKLYSDHVIPLMGGIVARDRGSYEYLVESIRRFPAPEYLEERLKKAGFGRVKWRFLSGGIAAIHEAWRL